MTTQVSGVINTPINFYFTATTGITDFNVIATMVDGALNKSINVTYNETNQPGLYYGVLTPNVTGRYAFYLAPDLLVQIDVLPRDILSYVKNIEDEALGSWVWDKQAGTLAMIRQNGTALANFTVVESLTIASREAGGGQ